MMDHLGAAEFHKFIPDAKPQPAVSIFERGEGIVSAHFNNGFKLISEIGMFHFGTHAANLRTQVKEHRAAKQNDH